VFAAGRLAEFVALGSSDEAARARIEAGVRADFDTMARALRVMALGMADPASVVAASRDDVTAARRLFAAADAALAPVNVADFALTAYGEDGRPLAWNGRPSDLPADRLQGEEAWFLAQGALGLRLVYVTPVLLPSGVRVGSVAAERSLARGSPSRERADAFRYFGPIAPVSIALRFEGGPTVAASSAFDVMAPSGALLFTATVDAADLAETRNRWRRASLSLALITCALALALLSIPLLDWRARLTRAGPSAAAVAGIAAAIAASRVLLTLGSPGRWSDHSLFSGAEYSSRLLGPFLSSPYEFLATAAATAGVVALLLGSMEAWRLRPRRRRPTAIGVFVLAQLSAGVWLATLLVAYESFLRDTVASTTLDLLHFSLHPWSTSRLALHVGLIAWHASAIGCSVLVLRAASATWGVSRTDWRFRVACVALWTFPLVAWQLTSLTAAQNRLAPFAAAAVAVGLASFTTRVTSRYRHGSQAFRLTMLTLSLMVPAMAFYPLLYQLGWQAKARLVETRYAPQAIDQRGTILRLLQESLDEIDRFPALAELTSAPPAPAGTEAPTDRAFQLWRVTGLAMYPVTSSVELYAADGSLISRFAFNLPDDLSAAPRVGDQACTWDVYEEVSPFFAEERRILHAGRALCDAEGLPIGSIVMHAMLDYANLPFILSQSPYVELMRPVGPTRGEDISGRDIEFAFYGWSRRPLYASAVTAWPIDDAAFERVEQTRTPIWARLQRGGVDSDVYLLNDRSGIYALGFPIASALDHLVSLAEITVLAWGTHLLLLTATALLGMFTYRGTTARALLREVRASFYRKLLLAFILATVIPVVALAVATRTYVADQMRTNVEQDAVRMASAARRVVEDLVAPRAAQQGADVDDNLMVWVSRLIDQDVNIFAGPRLLATSERNLFASGLLPTRTPASVYRAIALRSDASIVVREQLGDLNYLVAATPMTTRNLDAVLTVPLTTRELQIEGQIDTLDRRVLLGALLFVFCGASLGYWLAERIADPVNRLTRATRRIARGELDARIIASSSDELGRLVEDFNRMAGELQRQHTELERTHRLEAWAEMARQVAHEIKNPLTPIQLNAEHLRRVNADRGEPLSPVLNECVSTILEQVGLLRQIASEFSNFASSPTAKPSRVYLQDLLRDALAPYRAGLGSRIRFEEDVPSDLPPVFVDRTLTARSLTNLVENALHAMPSGGSVTVVARAIDGGVRIRFSDTGVGMDAEALARAFEPYFSTKTSGTGLGLPIAKRNIELSGGTITVSSVRDQGTTVEVTLPAATL
jgi:signal transduction histidine kinase